MNKEAKGIPTVDLIFGMEELEEEIKEKIEEFNLLRDELIRRFPPLKDEPAFKLNLEGDKDVKIYHV